MAPFFVTDVNKGFALEGPRKAQEEDAIKLRCSASVYDYENITWYKHTMDGDRQLTEGNDEDMGEYKIHSGRTAWSFYQELTFPNVSLTNRGR